MDGARWPPTIGATSTSGGTSTTGASCRSSATRSSILHGRAERAEPPRGRRPTGRTGGSPPDLVYTPLDLTSLFNGASRPRGPAGRRGARAAAADRTLHAGGTSVGLGGGVVPESG